MLVGKLTMRRIHPISASEEILASGINLLLDGDKKVLSRPRFKDTTSEDTPCSRGHHISPVLRNTARWVQ